MVAGTTLRFPIMRQHAEITFKTEETVVLREGSKVCIDQCSRCGRLALMVTPRVAAFLSNVSEREIFGWLELNLLHFTEKDRVMICLDSLKLIEKEIRPRTNEAGD